MLVRLFALLLLVAGCASPAPTEPISEISEGRPPVASAEQSTAIDAARQEVLQIARSFANYRWTGGAENSFHGVDEWRNQIDTPDQGHLPDHGWGLNGEENLGVAYQWGGFSDLQQFEAGVKRGLMAGHLPTRGQSGFTREAVGVDCSGLVSRCWGLPRKQSTRSLPGISIQLSSYDDLLPGDILNLSNKHTMVFVGFPNSSHQTLHVIEATASKGKVHNSVHDRAALIGKGYLPLRFKGLVH